jgi:hypothetical protein
MELTIFKFSKGFETKADCFNRKSKNLDLIVVTCMGGPIVIQSDKYGQKFSVSKSKFFAN